MSDIIKKTIILESTADYTRVMTQCDDQDYVRDFYLNTLNKSKSLVVLGYMNDVLMDINLKYLDTIKDSLTPEQLATYNKIKAYHAELAILTLQSNTWEIDWIYDDMKRKQNALNYQFFLKRIELQLGNSLFD